MFLLGFDLRLGDRQCGDQVVADFSTPIDRHSPNSNTVLLRPVLTTTVTGTVVLVQYSTVCVRPPETKVSVTPYQWQSYGLDEVKLTVPSLSLSHSPSLCTTV